MRFKSAGGDVDYLATKVQPKNHSQWKIFKTFFPFEGPSRVLAKKWAWVKFSISEFGWFIIGCWLGSEFGGRDFDDNLNVGLE